MCRIVRTAALAAAVVVLVFVAEAQAATRVFVSGTGADSGTCSRTAPCRSFAYAMGQAGVGGEIVVLDSAGYGAVTITNSLTITNPGGVEAGISATSGAAITISASTGTTVVLRGLTIEGDGQGTDGILVAPDLPSGSGVATVDIIDCVVKDFTGNGINISPTGAGSIVAVLIDNTHTIDNSTGIQFNPDASIVVLPTINGTNADHNTATGINFANAGGVQALMVNSHADYNQGTGIIVRSSDRLVMKSSTAYGNDDFLNNDIVNSGVAFFFNDNTINALSNSGTASTDGTNNILNGGTGLTKISPN